jgi:hypothetical protein
MLDLILGYAVSEVLDEGVPRAQVTQAYQRGMAAGRTQVKLELREMGVALDAIEQAVQDRTYLEQRQPQCDVVMGAMPLLPVRREMCRDCGSAGCRVEGKSFEGLERYECAVCGAIKTLLWVPYTTASGYPASSARHVFERQPDGAIYQAYKEAQEQSWREECRKRERDAEWDKKTWFQKFIG